ncbi:MAG: ComEC/Rec2 family competence protein [Eubacteriales bacterium]
MPEKLTKGQRIALWIVIIVLCLVGICHAIYDAPPIAAEERYTLTFLDVGQGDCTLIRTPQGGTALIDCGTTDSSDSVVAALMGQGIREIDFLIFSHAHEDHVGGAVSILNSFTVKKIYMGDYDLSGDVGSKILLAADCPIEPLTAGDRITLDGVEITVLAPDHAAENGENNDSLVLRLNIGGVGMLFTGDLEAEGEDQLVDRYGSDLHADLLKVAHHGSNYSTSERFLDAVSPSAAVISVGAYNTFGHPGLLLLERLSGQGISVYRTDQMGSVVFYTDGRQLICREKPWTASGGV